jgi:ABC-type glycerol-3-phosphate transport system substrate-binding protein
MRMVFCLEGAHKMGSRNFTSSVFLAVTLITAACTTAVPAPISTSAPQATQPTEATATTVPPTDTAEAPTATAAPTAATEVPATAEAAPTERKLVIASDGMVEPYKLFTDASGKCIKNVTLKMMTHGDYFDKNVDERYGLGLLLKRWKEGQPCVTLDFVPVPPGDAPGFAESQFIAGTPTDIVSTWSTSSWYDKKWVITYDDYLTAKNPYSDNKTWYEDFPYPDLTEKPYPADQHFYAIQCCIRTGATGPDGIVYNADLLKAAGVDVEKEMPPKTMTELINISKKVKAIGKIPFWLSLAGDTRWEIDWYGRFIMDQLMPDVAAAMDKEVDETDDKWGTLSEMESTYGVLTGTFKATDPRVGEYFRIMKEWSQYWEPGYASPAELVGEVASEFLKGNVAMTTVGRWRISTIQNYPDLKFQWGTFFLPPIDKEFSKFATGEPIRRHGGAGDPASTVIVPLFISSQVAKDPDKLAAAIDVLQYVTAPKSLDFYCAQLIIPCFKPGASLDEVFAGDKVREQRLRGFFEPAPVDIPVLGVYHSFYTMEGGSDEVTRAMVEYLQNNIDLETLQKRVQDGIMAGAKASCAKKLSDKVTGWEWCDKFK